VFPLQLPAKVLRRIRAGLTRAFFANFFRLLLIATSLSQWCVTWWIFPGFIASLPLPVQAALPIAIYATNRWLVRQTQRYRQRGAPLGRLPRLYYAHAFTCLFCTSFLLVTGAVWLSAKVFLEAITVQAGTVQASLAVGSSLNTAFRWLANCGMAVIAVAFAYGYSFGQLRLRITRLQLPLRNWSTPDGLRIVQVSDIHIGQNLEPAQLERFVARVNDLRPDLICITGDIIDAPSTDLARSLPLLARLQAPHGVFAILGNHDHYAGADRVEAALRRLTPFTVLRDQHTAIEVNGQRLHIVGLDDRGRDWARGVFAVPYLRTAIAAIPADEPVLVLCHRPDIFPQAAACGVALTLSGHTHGGQLGMPWFDGRVRNLAEFITAFDRGLFERDGSYLYVNCGLGVTGQRIRLFTPREITLIEIQARVVRRLAA
jgi:predicted MPP superfamily phosphohydrolase